MEMVCGAATSTFGRTGFLLRLGRRDPIAHEGTRHPDHSTPVTGDST